jgi:hypothetical protein
MTTRIIVTGSRRWTNRTAIREALAKTAGIPVTTHEG